MANAYPTDAERLSDQQLERGYWDAALQAIDDLAEAIESWPAIWRWGDGNGGALLHELEKRLNEIGLSRFPPKSIPKIKRKLIPWTIRYAVMERDGFKCIGCGAQKALTVDHIVALANGGSEDEANLQTLCKSCNSSKGVKSMDEWRR